MTHRPLCDGPGRANGAGGRGALRSPGRAGRTVNGPRRCICSGATLGCRTWSWGTYESTRLCGATSMDYAERRWRSFAFWATHGAANRSGACPFGRPGRLN